MPFLHLTWCASGGSLVILCLTMTCCMDVILLMLIHTWTRCMHSHLYVMNIFRRLTVASSCFCPTFIHSLILVSWLVVIRINIESFRLKTINLVAGTWLSFQIQISLRLILLYHTMTHVSLRRCVVTLRDLQLHLLDLIHMLYLSLA